MLRTLSHLVLGIDSHFGDHEDPGQVVVVLDTSVRMAQAGVADGAIEDTVSIAPAPSQRIRFRLIGGRPGP